MTIQHVAICRPTNQPRTYRYPSTHSALYRDLLPSSFSVLHNFYIESDARAHTALYRDLLLSSSSMLFDVNTHTHSDPQVLNVLYRDLLPSFFYFSAAEHPHNYRAIPMHSLQCTEIYCSLLCQCRLTYTHTHTHTALQVHSLHCTESCFLFVCCFFLFFSRAA